ncbi:lamin tail domain-containing protein [Faecalibacter bovis]|uniref:Lamin tail domain-containing protein n=1 Tax=Faecalibacter bovis TaxID=2898187 RepID=A0ABX7XA87_9FLAO|nr:lamin tail domain-containing protein [Faecalibacter bovis]QTV04799.1 lamin tail domain-containing protein [Faecalibacter bovis]
MKKDLFFKSIFTFLITLLCHVGFGQEYYNLLQGNFNENFNNISNWGNNYTGGYGAQYWKVANGPVFSVNTSGGIQKGNQNLILLATGTNTTSTDLLINFTGVNADKISLDWKKETNTVNSNPRNAKLIIQYSINGVDFFQLPNFVNPIVNNNNTSESGNINLDLPSALSDESNVVFRFIVNRNSNSGSGNNPKIAIDNIHISGLPIVQTAPILTTPQTVTGTYGVLINQTITGEHITPSTNWFITGTKPTGVDFANGVFNGSPNEIGLFTSSVKAKNGNLESDEITVNFDISKANQKFPVDIPVGQIQGIIDGEIDLPSHTLHNETDVLANSIVYTTDNPLVVSVVGNKLNFVGVGNATITATSANSNTNYNPIDSESFNVIVNKRNQTINNFNNITETFGSTINNLSATTNSGLSLTYEIVSGQPTDVINLSGNQVTILNAGNTQIRAYNAGNANYEPVEKIIDVTINKAEQTLSTTLADIIDNINTYVSRDYSKTDQNLLLNVISDDNNIAYYENGNIHLIGYGETFLKIKNEGDRNYNQFNERIVNVKVNDPDLNECVNVNFDTSFSISEFENQGWEFGSVTVGGQSCSGTNGIIFNGKDDYLKTKILSSPREIRFNKRRSGNTTAWGMKVEIMEMNSTEWTTVKTINSITTTCQEEVIDLTAYVEEGKGYYIRLIDTRASGTHERTIDDIKIICKGEINQNVVTPLIKPASLVTHNKFQVNWEKVDNSDYLLDVYSKVLGNYTTDLMFSEYVEGSNYNKALEIYNGTGNSINLKDYKISRQSNGEGDFGNTYTFDDKVLEHGETILLINELAEEDLIDLSLINNSLVLLTPVTFNGDDAIVLKKNNIVIDQIGLEGDTNNWGEDVTLRRKPSANPNPIYHDTEWDEYPQNTFDGLGQHSTNIDNGIKKSYIVRNQEVLVNTTSYVVDTNVDKFIDYYYVVRSKLGNTISDYSQEMDVRRTYFENGSWTTEPSHVFHSVILEGEFNQELVGKSITIDIGNGNTNTITGGNTYFPKHSFDVLSGTITFKENAYLLQEDDESINFGNATFERNATFFRYDSKFWSSPVAERSISGFMPNPSGIYTYNTAYRNWDNTTDTNFLTAKGYIFQAGANYPFYGNGDQILFDGKFTGVPHNGNYSVPVSYTGLGDNGVGNPYGSPISASAFLNENDHVTRLYFWDEESHYIPGTNPPRYEDQSWSALNQTGHNDGPTKFIGVGVGFIARVDGNDDIVFNNSMRTSVTNAGDIYNRTSTEKDRFWLSLNLNNNKENQILIGYVEGATNGIDDKYDAKNLSNNNSFILSHSNANAMIIEGRQYPLDVNDQIPLYFRASELGDYTIKLENKEGIFNSQPIYLIDNELNLSINLNEETEYTFNSEIGNFIDRFEIRYQPKETLSTNDLDDTTDLIVYKNEKLNKVTSKVNVVGYKVYDLAGRLISDEKVNQLKDFSLTNQNKGTYIVKFTLENGRVISKKVIF